MKRINKKEARRKWDEGALIVVVPCKIRVDNIWGIGMPAQKPYMPDDITFDDLINAYEYYNCNYETGYYAAYWVEE